VPRAAESDEGPEEITRDTIKRLTKLFYYSKAGEAASVQDSRYMLMSPGFDAATTPGNRATYIRTQCDVL
jgi:hypothetical protein